MKGINYCASANRGLTGLKANGLTARESFRSTPDSVVGEKVVADHFPFVFLVALGIDYNIFLMTRVREESAAHGTRRGALIGLAATGGVITSAGAVLAGTFAMLGTLPMVMFAEIGFAVALGVLLDTIVVRSVLVTALTLDIGRWMWWPGRLARPGIIAAGPRRDLAASSPETRRQPVRFVRPRGAEMDGYPSTPNQPKLL